MPTENERKYVLKCVNPSEELEELMGRNRYSRIYQGYLVNKRTTCRVRCSYYNDGRTEYRLTVKRKVSGRVVEIETDINYRDFLDLYSVCKRKVQKIRVYVEDWEVDFFLGPDRGIYFVMAEYEMPEGQNAPETMTGFVRDRLVFEVPVGDDRFSNGSLSKVSRASSLHSFLCKDARR